MTDFELGWLVALFEGEGNICAMNSRTSFRGIEWRAQIKMTDEDVVRRLYNIVGIGHVTDRQPDSDRKHVWEWRCTRQEDLLAFLSLINPYLGERRRSKAQECLDDLIVTT